MKLGAHLVGEENGLVKARTNAFDRVMLQCNMDELPVYNLAKAAEEAFQKLHMSKMIGGAWFGRVGRMAGDTVGQAFVTSQHQASGRVRFGLSLHRRCGSRDMGQNRHGRRVAVLLHVRCRRSNL